MNTKSSETIGQRLRSERQRFKLIQKDMGTIGGVTVLSQANYEKDLRQPDTAYLERLAAHGVDVLYVITGQRMDASSLSTEELVDELKKRHPEARIEL